MKDTTRDGAQKKKRVNKYVLMRILSYLRPYVLYVVLFLVALILATIAEMNLPLIIRRVIDENLLVRYERFRAGALEQEGIVEDEEAWPRIENYVYVRESALTNLSGSKREALVSSGTMDETEYYVFLLNDELPAHGELVTGESHGAIPLAALDELSSEERSALRASDLSGLKRNSLIFLVFLAGLFVFSFAQVYILAAIGQGVMKDFRLSLFKHTMGQSMSFLSTQPVGRLVTRVTSDVETINELFTQVLSSFLKNIAIMIGVVVVIFLLSVRLGVITMVTLLPIVLITVFSRAKVKEAFRRVRDRVAQLNTFLSEYISGMSVVQLFVQEDRTVRQFKETSASLVTANMGQVYVYAIFRPLIDLFYAISTALILYFGASFLLRDMVTLGVLIAYISLVNTFYQQVMSISEGIVSLQNAVTGGEKIFSLLDHEDRIPDTGTRTLKKPVQGSIVFENVSFSYRKDEPVLHDFSVEIKPGQVVALVGYTGAGKTTISNLLVRFWDVDSGRILLDGVDIRDIPLKELRSTMQSIPQDVFLFRDSVEENIQLGAAVGKDAIEAASKEVNAHKFISRLPKGYETMLEEDASNISTGQRQLLTFARAIAHDPRVIILDEATANIDTETERLIQAALAVLFADRTSLVIAHRLSTIEHADNILVLSEGRLVEQGNYAALMKKQGLFYMLSKMQEL